MPDAVAIVQGVAVGGFLVLILWPAEDIQTRWPNLYSKREPGADQSEKEDAD